MSYGVECWNAAGQKTLGIDSRVAKFLGTTIVGVNHTGNAQSGTITDARFTAYPGTTPFYLVIGGSFDRFGNGLRVSFSGNTLTWQFANPLGSFPHITRPNTRFVYGIF